MGIFRGYDPSDVWDKSARLEGGAQRIIEYAHVAVHDDGFVIASDYVAELDIITPRVYLIMPPATHELHVLLEITSTAPVLIEIYKAPTVTANGTAILHMRPNFYSSKNILTTYHTPTVTDDGAIQWRVRSGGVSGNAVQRVGGSTRNGEEIIVHPAAPMLVRITATSNDTVLSFQSEYYEVPAGTTDR